MFGIGRFKEDVLLAVDYAISVLAPGWVPERGAINEYLAEGASLAAAAFVRGTVSERKGAMVPESALTGLAEKLTAGLPSQLPATATPEAMARIAAEGAGAFRSAYPEGSVPRTLADEALAAFKARQEA